jgi:UDP-GlcNAc:undecaprenyl-phosphate GlcNAc-1-phosphate transferase
MFDYRFINVLSDTLIVGLSTLLISVVATPLCMKLAKNYGLVDMPNDDNKKHGRPVPYMGGIPIAIALFLVLAVFGFFHRSVGFHLLLFGSIGFCIVGLIDDVWTMKYYYKIVIEAVFIVVLATIGGIAFGNGLTEAFDILFILALANSSNLFDNFDLSLSSVTIVSAIAILIIAYKTGNLEILIISAALGGSVLGFSFFNVPPAKVFLGDTGSLLIGYMLAYCELRIDSGHNLQFLLQLWATCFIFVLDTSSVILARTLNNRSIFHGGYDHISHRLKAKGIDHPMIIAIFVALTAFGFIMRQLLLVYPGLSVYLGLILAAVFIDLLLFFIRIPVYNS